MRARRLHRLAAHLELLAAYRPCCREVTAGHAEIQSVDYVREAEGGSVEEEEEVWRLDWLVEASGSTSDTVLGVVPWHHERYDDGRHLSINAQQNTTSSFTLSPF